MVNYVGAALYRTVRHRRQRHRRPNLWYNTRKTSGCGHSDVAHLLRGDLRCRVGGASRWKHSAPKHSGPFFTGIHIFTYYILKKNQTFLKNLL